MCSARDGLALGMYFPPTRETKFVSQNTFADSSLISGSNGEIACNLLFLGAEEV